MAIPAQLARPGRQHGIICLGDGMIAMALAAFGPVMFIECVFVFAAVEQAGIG